MFSVVTSWLEKTPPGSFALWVPSGVMVVVLFFVPKPASPLWGALLEINRLKQPCRESLYKRVTENNWWVGRPIAHPCPAKAQSALL